MVEVKIKGMVITGQYGALSEGTILRTSEEFAKHLVNECNAAEYVTKAPEPAPEPEEPEPEQKRGRGRPARN